MLSIKQNPIDWVSMADMGEEALDGFSPRDSAMFCEIRDALVNHGALEIFGIYLIHKHFDISSDEEMIEEVDFSTDTMVIRPRCREELNMADMVPTNWIFQPGNDGGIVVQVAQWGRALDMPKAEHDPFRDKHAQCFADIRGILAKHSSVDRFGMFLLRHQFDFDLLENQLECTDQPARTLTLTRQTRSSNSDQTIPTNWYFTPDEIVAVNCCECARNANGHLAYHRQK